MQKIIFANNKTLEVEQINGGYANGRETLVFTVSEAQSSFDELKEIMNDIEATNTITIRTETENEDGELVENITENVQTGFIIPGPLTYENGRFMLTLEKPTVQEKRIAELEGAVMEMAAVTKQADRQQILDSLNITAVDTLELAKK